MTVARRTTTMIVSKEGRHRRMAPLLVSQPTGRGKVGCQRQKGLVRFHRTRDRVDSRIQRRGFWVLAVAGVREISVQCRRWWFRRSRLLGSAARLIRELC